MQTPMFLQSFGKGRHAQEPTLENSDYCIFYTPLTDHFTANRITGDAEHFSLELLYGTYLEPASLRLRQVGTNVVIEEANDQRFCAYIAERSVKYFGQLIMYALQFTLRALTVQLEGCSTDMAKLENDLDRCIDNTGTYQILDFRRKYTEIGASVIALKEILARIDKGYYPMQMQSSYVLQGEVALEFQFLEERYDLIKTTLIKDLDTYTSIINNNINRNTRLLSIISLIGVVLNFAFGSLLAVNPLLGIVGGVTIAMLSVVAVARYHTGSRKSE